MAKQDKAKKEKLMKLGLAAGAVILLVLSLFLFAENSGLSNEVNDLNNEVSELQQDKEDFMNAVELLNEKVAKLEVDVEECADSREALAEQVGNLLKENGDLENELSALEEEVAGPEGYVFELDLGMYADEKIDDGEYDVLLDGEIEFNGDEYDIHEELIFDDNVEVQVSGLGGDKEFGAEPYVAVLDKGAILYRYVFDDVIDMTEISDDEPLIVELLNKRLEIIEMDSNSMIVRFGDEYVLNEGQSLGDLLFVDVSEYDDYALFKYGDEEYFVEEGEKIDLPNGQELLVKETIAVHSSDKERDVVIFYLGDGVEEEYNNADEILEDPDWELYWDTTGDDLNFFEIRYMEKGDELDDDYPPLAIGESIVFPWEAYAFVFDGYKHDPEFVGIELFFDEENAEDDLLVDRSGVWLSAESDVFIVDDEEVSDVFLVKLPSNWEIYYFDDDDYFTKASTDLWLEHEDTLLEIELETSGQKDIVIDDGYCELRFDVNAPAETLGNTQEEAEVNEVKYCGNGIGDREEDVLTGYGIIIESPENNGEDDVVLLQIPSDQLVANLRVV